MRATDTLFSTTAQFQILRVPTSSNGTTFGPGSANNLLKSNGTSVYWTTLAASDIPTLSITDKTTGTLPVTRGGTGVTAIANIQAGKDGDGNTISSTYLKLSGGTMTGQIVLASTGFKTNATTGYSLDINGNFTHLRDTNTDNFQIKNNTGTPKFQFYWETGNVTAAGTITAPTFSGSLSGNAATATALTSSAGSSTQPIYFSSGKPVATSYALEAQVKYTAHNATTGGWSTLLGRQSTPTISIVRHQETIPTWISEGYSSSLVWGGGDTKGLLNLAYSTPIVVFGGGSTNGSTDDNPNWYFKISGTTGQTYTFPSSSKTLAATDGTGASGTWGISISGNAANVTGTVAVDHGGTGATSPSAAKRNLAIQVQLNTASWNDVWTKLSNVTIDHSAFFNITTEEVAQFVSGTTDLAWSFGIVTGTEIGNYTLIAFDINGMQYAWRIIGLTSTSGTVETIRKITFNKVQNTIAYTGTKASYDMIKFIDNTGDEYGNGISIGGGGATIIGGGESASTAMAQVSGGNEILYLCNDGDVNIFSNMQDGWASRKTFTFDTNGGLSVPGLINNFKLYVGGAINADDVRTTNGIWTCNAAITNAPTTNHGTLFGIASVGTPFQFFMPDASYYVYKRYISSSAWTSWTKIYAGYADSAGSATKATQDGSGNTITSTYAKLASHNNLTASGNEFTFAASGQSGAVWFNYRTAGGTNGNITQYCFGDGKTGSLANITSGNFSGNAATATNADKVDNYHASDLWRKDGGTWNGNANIACTPTAANQEYSFDLGNAYTGTYWHVWSSKNSASILQCYNDDRHVAIPVHLYVGGYNNTSYGISTSSLATNGNLLVNASNTTGAGIILSDDGDIVDLNNGYCSMRFSSGVDIYSGNKGGSIASRLSSNGVIQCYRVTANLGGSERRVEVDQGTAGALYLFSNPNGKGLYSSTGYATGYVIRINSGGITHYGTVSSSSSKEVKTNIQYLNNTDYIDELKPVSFIYKKDEKKKTHFGLIYEDTIDILPNICTIPEEDESKGINYIELVPVLLKEIQNLRKRIKSLEDNK